MSGSGSVSSKAATENIVQAAPVEHVKVGDISVGYRVIGPLAAASSGTTTTPLLMITGSSSTMDLWPPAFITSLAQDRAVILFDNRGMGETDNPRGAYPFTQLADDTAAFITALGHERADVLGWSMGAFVALDLTVRHPAVVGRLVSYAGAPGGALAIPMSPQVLAVLEDTSGGPEARGMRLLEQMFPEAYRTAHPDYARRFPIPKETVQPAEIGYQNEAIGRWAGVGDGLALITSPTLFVTGTEDLIAPPQNAVVMADRVPGSWLMRFAGTGHGLMYQEPESLADSILLFLRVTGVQGDSSR